MSGLKSRRKGIGFELEVAEAFRTAIPWLTDIRRGLSQPRGGGAEEPDVICPFLHIECKRGIKPNIMRGFEQAQRDAQPGLIPVAITRGDNQAAMVTLRLEDFLPLFRSWLNTRPELCAVTVKDD
jgi:hypothetical protein